MKNDHEVKAIFFDAADTLFYIKGGVGYVYWSVAKKYGANSTPDQIEKAFGKAFRSAPPLTFSGVSSNERKVNEKRWWFNVVKNVFTEVGMFSNFEDYFNELFETFRTNAWELFPETKEVLSTIKKRELKLGIISNFDTRVYDVCTDLGIIDYFDKIVISSEAGFAKPSQEIFNRALNEMGISATNSLHIGDSLELDFYGARSVGINALLLDKRARYKARDDILRIENLADVLEFVGDVDPTGL